MTVEAIFAVTGEVVDARVVASINMVLSALLVALALVHCEVLLGAEALNPQQLVLKLLILQEVFVEH